MEAFSSGSLPDFFRPELGKFRRKSFRKVNGIIYAMRENQNSQASLKLVKIILQAERTRIAGN
jgi:hypothetical protein